MKLTLDAAKRFAKEKIESSNRPNYPFRSRYRHTLRVLMWVERLHKELGGDLDVLRYSAILHDCDWNGTENHAITSYESAKSFLNKFDIDSKFKEKVLEGVRYHNEKSVKGLSKETHILMDADELDEVGAVCIMWDILAQQHEKKVTSYKEVLERIKRYTLMLHKNVEKLNFQISKDIYKRKMLFQEMFIKEAEEELEIEL